MPDAAGNRVFEDKIVETNCTAPSGTCCNMACIFNDSLAWCKWDKRRQNKNDYKNNKADMSDVDKDNY